MRTVVVKQVLQLLNTIMAEKYSRDIGPCLMSREAQLIIMNKKKQISLNSTIIQIYILQNQILETTKLPVLMVGQMELLPGHGRKKT